MNEELEQTIINRLHRVEWQVRGVEKMIYQKKPYSQIIQQLEAVRSAANNIIVNLVEDRFCDENKKISTEDIEYLKRFIKRM